MELRERREVSRLHRDEEQAIYEEVMLIDERCAKEEREEAARQRLNERKREREQAEDARKASPAARQSGLAKMVMRLCRRLRNLKHLHSIPLPMASIQMLSASSRTCRRA